MKAELRCKIEDNKFWFPLVDITRYSKQGNRLHKSAINWLKNNLAAESFRKIRVEGTTTQRGGVVICVDSDSLRIVGMYESHLQTGKDFRVKWSDLPDTPNFPSKTKKELSWRNLYIWSKTEHQKNSGLCAKQLSELRAMYFNIKYKLDIEDPCKEMSLKEVLTKLGVK